MQLSDQLQRLRVELYRKEDKQFGNQNKIQFRDRVSMKQAQINEFRKHPYGNSEIPPAEYSKSLAPNSVEGRISGP